jgi:GntR family galactonate operon transcriptional repressor
MIGRPPVGGYHGRGLHGEVVERLGQLIMSGELAEGATLEVAELGAELDVSRSVLREALRVLKAKGLIDARQKRGTYVQPRTEWRLLDADVIRWQFEGRSDERLLNDLAELRGIIEPASAGLAAGRRTEEDLVVLQQALDGISAAARGVGDPVEADLAFHRALLAATHNELLIRTEAVLEAGLAVRDRLVHGTRNADPTPEHAAILDAIRDGDPVRAVDAASSLLARSLLDLDQVRSASRPMQGQL